MTDNDTVRQVVRDARYYTDANNPCFRCGSEKSDHPNREYHRWVQHVPPPGLLPQMADIIEGLLERHEWAAVPCGDSTCESCEPVHKLIRQVEEQQREIDGLKKGHALNVEALCCSHADWWMELTNWLHDGAESTTLVEDVRSAFVTVLHQLESIEKRGFEADH